MFSTLKFNNFEFCEWVSEIKISWISWIFYFFQLEMSWTYGRLDHALLTLLNRQLTQGKSDLFGWDIPHFISGDWRQSHTPDGQVVWLGWFIAIHPCQNRLQFQKSTFVFSLFSSSVDFYKTDKKKICHQHFVNHTVMPWLETVQFMVM